MGSLGRVISRVTDSADREVLEIAARSGAPVVACEDDSVLGRVLSQPGAGTLLGEAGVLRGFGFDRAEAWRRASSSERAIVLRTSLTESEWPALHSVLRADAKLALSFRPYHSLDPRTALVPCAWMAPEVLETVRSVAGVLSPQQRETLLAIAILSQRPTTEAAIAAALGLSARGLRRRIEVLREAHPALPKFPVIAGTFVVYDLIAAASVVGRVTHDLIVRAGFLESKLMAEFAVRNTGFTVRRWLEGRGAGGLDDRICGWFAGVRA